MERKAIFVGNLFHIFNNFIKIMCYAICRYKINLSISLELYLYHGAADEAEHPMWAL